MRSSADIVKHARSMAFIACTVFGMTLLCLACKSKTENHDSHQHDMSDMKDMNMNSESMNDSILLSSLTLPVNSRVISSQKSVKPILNTTIDHIDVHGYISLDERRSEKVSARISGRIEKLYVRYNLQWVNKGEKILDLYSPELITYQNDFLYLIKNNSDEELITEAEEKLRLLGVSQDQIGTIKKTGSPLLALGVYSPQSGFVFFDSPEASKKPAMTEVASNEGMNEMQSSSTSPGKNFTADNSQLREGSYINEGDVLFRVNDLQHVWGLIAISNDQQHEVKLGDKVSLVSELYKNDTIRAGINFIEPVYQQDQKFVIARIYLSNSQRKFKINSLIECEIKTASQSNLMIPYSSVLFLGKREIVWVLIEKQNNHQVYEARDVLTGTIYNNMIEIKSGLRAKEEVASNAAYLMDSESLIKPK